jgi:hypothetical protein
MKKVIRLTENDLTRIVKRVLREQSTDENKVEVYGLNDDTYVHWDFPSLKTNPSVIYNLSIKCTKNCQGVRSSENKEGDYSLDKKGMKVNELKLFLGSSYNNIKFRNYLVKVDAVSNGKVVASISKEYGPGLPDGKLTDLTAMIGGGKPKTF